MDIGIPSAPMSREDRVQRCVYRAAQLMVTELAERHDYPTIHAVITEQVGLPNFENYLYNVGLYVVRCADHDDEFELIVQEALREYTNEIAERLLNYRTAHFMATVQFAPSLLKCLATYGINTTIQ